MPKHHRLKTRKGHDLAITIPVNFLLGCSQSSLDAYELARLAEVADLRKELLAILDRAIEQNALAILARWFRQTDRNSINAALAIEETPEQWANRRIRESQRSEDELLPLASLPPGAAHLAAAVRYQERNIAEGKCQNCPQPLDPNSVRFCTKHLTAARMRHKPQGGEDPGSRDFLYQDHSPEKRHGRQPGTLKVLATARAQAQRALLAELGIPPESAAITLDAAKAALLKNMPARRAEAKPAAELWQASLIPSLRTGRRALRELLAEGKIQRVGRGVPGNAFRWHLSD